MIFVDSSVWDASLNERDENHDLSRTILKEVKNGEYGKIIVTDYVIDEVLTWINRKVDHDTAVEISEEFFEDPTIETVKVNWAVIHRARELFSERDYLSFTDATTAVVMNTRDIQRIATFDSDFSKVGFEVISG